MPSTFPSHQGLIIGLKAKWPRHVDATAISVGAAAPDFAYPLGTWLNHQSHTAIGLLVWALPVTIVAAWVIRAGAAVGIFANMADLGPLRLRSYAVLGDRRPGWISTLGSAVIGSGSHVVIDAFTHKGRWGADWLGLNGVIAASTPRGEFTIARIGQYAGHVGGAALMLAFVLFVARTHRLEEWYSARAVALARARVPTTRERVTFWSIVSIPTLISVIAVRNGAHLFWPLTVLFVALLLGGTIAAAQSRNRIIRNATGKASK